MRCRPKTLIASLFLLSFLLTCLLVTSSFAEESISYTISGVKIELSDTNLTYTITGDSVPAYTVSKRFAPFRVVLDIAGASFQTPAVKEQAEVPANGFVSLALSEQREMAPSLLRFEFTLADSHDYTVEKMQKGVRLHFFPGKAEATVPATLPGVRELSDLTVKSTPNTTTVTIVSNGPIDNYTVDTIGSGVNRPPRMYIDIEDVSINELPRQKVIGTSVAQVRIASRGKGVRLVFDSATKELFKYTVAPSPEGLAVVIDESTLPPLAKATLPIGAPAPASAPAQDSTLDKLINSSEALLSQQDSPPPPNSAEAKAAALADDFSFAGYQKQRISVDFYKIDIHNVFRLFREVTDLNIIVDEEVQGSLTLALTDVPWDFALDIILNLMDLKKEERFNTIVIYPAKKDFVWPTRAEDNLAFEADVDVVQQEALVIQKSTNLPQEVMKAKEFLGKAHLMESQENYEDAALLYTKAFKLWPDNPKISNRLATLYLVNLGMNAKAVYYAKKSLEINPKDTKAALYAAIGSANMQRVSEAKDYFTQSISDAQPLKEALLSYAAFSENNGYNDAALKLIEKFHNAYGETVDTMVAKARILDKLGLTKDATDQYKAVLNSGFQIRPDLKKFISGRVAANNIK